MKEVLIKSSEIEKNIFLIEDEKLVEYYKEKNDNKTLEGNIYIGKVQNIITGLDAAFVNLGEGKNAFIHKKDILPKKNKTASNIEDNTSITKLIKPGDPILVEVKKDRMQTKGARVSTHITLRGRFIVLMPNAPYITVSSKIINEDKRKRLKDIVGENLPQDIGAIIRTNAENASKEDIINDIENQLQRWEKIQKYKFQEFPKKIYDSGGVLKRLLIDLVDYNLDRIVVDSNEIKVLVEEILQELRVKLEIKLSEVDIESLYNIKKQILNIKSNKIWLKSGAFITIDYTEALTAIDVNTGKFIGYGNSEETVCRVNQEAAIEIAKQIRLRDIGGIIIIDFIDMKEKEDMSKVIETLRIESLKDRSRLQIEGFTKLNLLECTRKHISINIK